MEICNKMLKLKEAVLIIAAMLMQLPRISSRRGSMVFINMISEAFLVWIDEMAVATHGPVALKVFSVNMLLHVGFDS